MCVISGAKFSSSINTVDSISISISMLMSRFESSRAGFVSIALYSANFLYKTSLSSIVKFVKDLMPSSSFSFPHRSASQ